MITADQPQCFGDHLIAALSSKSDGTVLDKTLGIHHPAIIANRKRFCALAGSDYAHVVYQRILYNHEQTYDVLREVTYRDTTRYMPEIKADGLITRERGVGLLLPVADCAATIVYDPKLHIVALLHLGRHSSLTSLIAKTIRAFAGFGSHRTDLIVWMAPSVQQSHYQLDYFDPADGEEWYEFVDKRDGKYFVDLQGHNAAVFEREGLSPHNIHRSSINTAARGEYFSHSQGDTSQRFAVLVQLI